MGYMESEEMDTLSVDDVTFMLLQCEPSNGIVTAATDMSATPITSREMRAIHEQKDAELARSIMENERNNARRQRQVMFGRGLPSQANINADPFMSFIRLMEQYNAMREQIGMQQQEEKQNHGLSEQIIRSLPTYEYKQSKKTKQNMEDADEEGESCRICLQEFKVGDEMRTLPCFHSFHRECVDQWLHINTKCPICKHSLLPLHQ